MADIAGIFHWSLAELEALDLEELLGWHARATGFWNRIHPKGKG